MRMLTKVKKMKSRVVVQWSEFSWVDHCLIKTVLLCLNPFRISDRIIIRCPISTCCYAVQVFATLLIYSVFTYDEPVKMSNYGLCQLVLQPS